MLFGIVFVGKSVAIGDEAFTRVDATHWTLDLRPLVGAAWADCKEACLFSTAGVLDSSNALALYVTSNGSPWEYRGCVTTARPSDVLNLMVKKT